VLNPTNAGLRVRVPQWGSSPSRDPDADRKKQKHWIQGQDILAKAASRVLERYRMDRSFGVPLLLPAGAGNGKARLEDGAHLGLVLLLGFSHTILQGGAAY
jgi:hypothetical protein